MGAFIIIRGDDNRSISGVQEALRERFGSRVKFTGKKSSGSRPTVMAEVD